VNNLLNIELCRLMYLRLFVVENNKLRAACGKSKIRETLARNIIYRWGEREYV
jgi:hypothetical protein